MNNKSQEKPCTCDANQDSIESCERHGTMKHTPTPWQANGTHIRYQKNAGGYRFDIAEVFRDVGSQYADANAQFIVKAVNCHDDLLEACKLVERAHVGDGVQMSTAVDACLLAIKKAGAQ